MKKKKKGQHMAEVRARRVGTDLTQGSILKTLLKFAFPILLTNLVQQLYNTVDLIIVGQFAGSHGTVGVSTGGDIVNFATMLSMGFASAGEVYISQLYGAGDLHKIKKTIGTLLTVMFAASVVFMIVCIAFCTPLLQLLNTPAEAFEQAKSYMIITAIGMPFIYGYNAVCSTLRGMGESRRPLLFVSIAAVSNIFMDLFFVAVLKMESAGTAIATVIAQFVSFAAAFIFMYKKREHFDFDFKLKSFTISAEPLKVLVRLGIPRAAQMALINVSLMFCNAQINTYGLAESAVNSVGNKIVRFSNIITQSIDQGAAAMVGQSLGARKPDRAKRVVYTALAFAMGMAAVNIVLSLTIPQTIFRIFSTDEAVIAYAPSFMRIQIITFVLAGIMGPYQGMVTGSGNAGLGFLAGMLDGVVLRIGLSLLFAYVFKMGIYGFFLGNAVPRIAPCIINVWYFYSNRWVTRKLLTED
jgi:putative MATE family efflux protein